MLQRLANSEPADSDIPIHNSGLLLQVANKLEPYEDGDGKPTASSSSNESDVGQDEQPILLIAIAIILKYQCLNLCYTFELKDHTLEFKGHTLELRKDEYYSASKAN